LMGRQSQARSSWIDFINLTGLKRILLGKVSEILFIAKLNIWFNLCTKAQAKGII
jgi:hypothetical protein